MREGIPVLFRLAEISFIDDGAGKPVGIYERVGQRPIAAFGNSDGDLQMLQWTTMTGHGRHLAMTVHQTDGEREYPHDRNTSFGRLDKVLDATTVMGWTIVSMKDDGGYLAFSDRVAQQPPKSDLQVITAADATPTREPLDVGLRRE
jgi:hypothetical protein